MLRVPSDVEVMLTYDKYVTLEQLKSKRGMQEIS
jgi:hypothetical protein